MTRAIASPEGRVRGSVQGRFRIVRELFEEAVKGRPGWSGSVAVYLDGDLVVDLWGGPSYRRDELSVRLFVYERGGVPVPRAAIDRGQLDPDRAVSAYWPEFAQAGKKDVPVRWLLSHQAGLVSVDGGFTIGEYTEHSALAERLARQQPYWKPGQGHGYHPLTWGTLVDELTRRVTGISLGEFYETELRQPHASTSSSAFRTMSSRASSAAWNRALALTIPMIGQRRISLFSHSTRTPTSRPFQTSSARPGCEPQHFPPSAVSAARGASQSCTRRPSPAVVVRPCFRPGRHGRSERLRYTGPTSCSRSLPASASGSRCRRAVCRSPAQGPSATTDTPARSAYAAHNTDWPWDSSRTTCRCHTEAQIHS